MNAVISHMTWGAPGKDELKQMNKQMAESDQDTVIGSGYFCLSDPYCFDQIFGSVFKYDHRADRFGFFTGDILLLGV